MDITKEQKSEMVEFIQGTAPKASSEPSTSNSGLQRTTINHPDEILNRLTPRLRVKYFNGQLEHGGNLWEKPVLGYMLEEIIDLVVYYDVLAEQHALAVSLLDDAVDLNRAGKYGHSLAQTIMARNILARGNASGQLHNDNRNDLNGGPDTAGYDTGGGPSPDTGGHPVPPGVERDRFDDY